MLANVRLTRYLTLGLSETITYVKDQIIFVALHKNKTSRLLRSGPWGGGTTCHVDDCCSKNETRLKDCKVLKDLSSSLKLLTVEKKSPWGSFAQEPSACDANCVQFVLAERQDPLFDFIWDGGFAHSPDMEEETQDQLLRSVKRGRIGGRMNPLRLIVCLTSCVVKGIPGSLEFCAIWDLLHRTDVKDDVLPGLRPHNLQTWTVCKVHHAGKAV